MSDDELTIATFFVGLAATLGTAAMSLAGLKHRGAIAALSAAAVAAAFLGLGRPWLKEAWPRSSAAVAEIETSSVAWFVVLMFGLALTLFRRPSPPRPSAAPADPVPPASAGVPADSSVAAHPVPPPPDARALYVAKMLVEAGKLASDYYLEFAIIVFNGTAIPLKVEGARGRVAFAVALPADEVVVLPPPTLREDTSTEVAPFSEFLVVLSQHVLGVHAGMLFEEFTAGRAVKFDFEKLRIEVWSNEWAEPARLPVWDGVTCRRVDKTVAVVGHIVNERIGDAARAGDGS